MKTLLTIFIIIVLLITGRLYGQIATYSPCGGTCTTVIGYPNEVVTSLLQTGFGTPGTPCSAGASGLSALTGATLGAYSSSGPHVYIKITPNTGYQLNVTGFTAYLRRSGSGPISARFAYSLDNGVTWTDDGTDHAPVNAGCGTAGALLSWGIGTLPIGISSTTNGIIVAIFPFGASASAGVLQVNGINILGTVTPGCTPPTITVSPLAPSFCAGTGGVTLTASGAGATGTYTWSPSTGLSASTGAAVTANPSATTTYTITGYSSATCSNTTTVTATINPLPSPAPITGASSVCVGASTTLNDATASGTWSITNPSLATITSSGMVTGILAGTDTAKYAVTNTCGTTTVSYPIIINPLPVGGAITGADSVCVGATIVLANATATTGGVWTSLNTAVATATGGTVGGVLADTTTVVYTITTACGTASAAHRVVVKALPFAGAISGADSVCFGTAISLTASVPGGVWSSANSAIASVSATGVVTGTSAALATTTIQYTVSTFSCGAATATHLVSSRPQPSAGTISGTTTFCNQAATVLTSTVPGGVWTSSNTGIAAPATGGTINGVAAGSATITYAVTNSCGTATATSAVVVNPLPPAIAGPTDLCVGANTVFANALPAGLWSSSAAAVATIDASGTAYGVAPGTTTITYTNSTTGCYITAPLLVNFSVPASVTITASTPTSVCAGTPVTYTAHIVNGGTSPLYVWSVDGVIITGTSSYTYTPADNDVVRCWIVSSLGCAVPDTASDLITMTVHHIATPQLALTTGTGDTVCVGALTTITPITTDGGAAPVYQWSVNTIPMSVGPTYSYFPANGDVISCTLTSNAFCRTADQASAIKILTVSPYLLPVVSTTINPGLTSCELYPVTYTASQVNGGTAPAYQWSVNGINTTTGAAFTYTPANGDQVQVLLTSNFPCVSTLYDTAISAMTVLPITQPIGVVNAVPGYIINEGANDTFVVTVLSGGGIAPTFQWFKNNVPIVGETGTSYVTNQLNTGDSINCVVTNTDQCSGVSVFNYVNVTIGDNVGVAQVGVLNNLVLAPNPNNGTFSIKGSIGNSDKELMLDITDMAGRKVYTTEATISNGSIDKQINVDQLPSGMYLLQLRSNTQTRVMHFVVE